MRDIITDILSLGIRVPPLMGGRRGGAGPAEGRAIVIADRAVNASIASDYAAASPYSLQETPAGGHLLCRNDTPICPVAVVPEPAFYGGFTETGVSYKKIALLHGTDCLASTILQRCRHWRTRERCAFCGTELSLQNGMTLARKSPAQLAEVARAAHDDGTVSHVVLTAGSADPPGDEIAHAAACARAIKTATGMPVHVQFAPPEHPDRMTELKGAGVDTVGIHIESFDVRTLESLAPAKARLGLSRYRSAWSRAVSLFGPNQVSSFLIVGLGETEASVLWGAELLADLGVYPFVVPFRPIPGSRMGAMPPPAPDVMKRINERVGRILANKGIASGKCRAGCVRCGACSGLPAYEETPAEKICHRARTPEEVREAFAIRQEVFVREQALFRETDQDANDAHSIHIVAKSDGEIVGTVRVFPANGNGHWIGGRLAVRKDHRVGSVGARLVREAMKRVKKEGCTHFTAHIQQQNVRFFQRIGWEPDGPLEPLQGQLHQHMVADLDRVPPDGEA